MPTETTSVAGFEFKETILRIGVPNAKFSEDYARYLIKIIQDQINEQCAGSIICVVVPEDTTLDTIYL